MPYAVMQKGLEPPTIAQLKNAFSRVPNLTAFDANSLCKETFGMIVRNFKADQALALQAGLKAEGIETEVVEESQLPLLPVAKTIRRIEFAPDALMIYDPLGQKFPVEWGHVLLIGAGCVRRASFQRTRSEWEVATTVLIQGVIPVTVRDTKVEFSSRESAGWVLRAEIVLTRAMVRYSIEAEEFSFACLGERGTRDLAANFCLLLKELMKFAPHAVLNRGATSIGAGSPGFVSYPHATVFHQELTWLLWQMARQRAVE
ncbi:MAG: hypothetical protein JWR26_4040 [Pedosphaera sp.]|nr:hypothetical protein [Pedosphaera sp.]